MCEGWNRVRLCHRHADVRGGNEASGFVFLESIETFEESDRMNNRLGNPKYRIDIVSLVGLCRCHGILSLTVLWPDATPTKTMVDRGENCNCQRAARV